MAKSAFRRGGSLPIRIRDEHLAAATAINVIRLDAWYSGKPLDRTRTTHLQRINLAPAT